MDDLHRPVLPDIRAHHVLADGSELVIRTVQPRDAVLLARGFAELSADSRYQRFFTPKAGLSSDELHALTELDGESHYAIGVTTWDAEGREVPIAVARYVRDPVDPELAEAAIVVIDAMQRRGIGRILMNALVEAAYAHGVRRFRAEVLVDNYPVHALLRAFASAPRVVERGPGSEELELVLRRPVRSVDPLSASSRSLEAASRAAGTSSYGEPLATPPASHAEPAAEERAALPRASEASTAPVSEAPEPSDSAPPPRRPAAPTSS